MVAALPLALACGGDDDGGTGPTTRPAAALAIRAGDNQNGPAGAALPVAPAVLVTDATGAPVANVAVTFVVATGGGSISGAQATSDAGGVATLGGWTLGLAAGENTLRATAPGVTGAVVFRATSLSADVCAQRQPLTLGAPALGSLATGDCRLDVGAYVDFHSFTLDAVGSSSHRFTMSSSVDALLTMVTAEGVPVAGNDDLADTATTASFRVIARPGAYVLGATSFERGEVGAYTITSVPVAPDVSRCEEVFLTPGITTQQTLQTTDCASAADAAGARFYSDGYLIWLTAGRAYTFDLASTAFDAHLTLVGPDNARVAENDAATPGARDARIAITPTRSGFHLLYAGTSLRAATGAYVLTMQ
jgi:hypothetical protein